MKKIRVFRTFVMGDYSFAENEIYELPTLMANGLLTMEMGEEVIEEEKPKKKKKESKKDKE